MKRSINLIPVTVVVLLLGFASSGLAQDAGQSKAPLKLMTPSGQLALPTPLAAPPRMGQIKLPATGAPAAASPVLHTPGALFVPASSKPQAIKPGHLFAGHTNVEIYVPSGVKPDEFPPYPGYGYETPGSIACHYGLVNFGGYTACNSSYGYTYGGTLGGSQSIAVVDAYDDPAASGDIAWFSLQFGLTLKPGQFQVIWANSSYTSCAGGAVPIDYTGGWEVEEALDIEWAHAMAGNATIYLVEACSNSDYDLLTAVQVATNLVQCGLTEI